MPLACCVYLRYINYMDSTSLTTAPRDHRGRGNEMEAAKFEVKKASLNGAPAFECVVRNSMSNPALHAECVRLGMEPTAGIANRRSVIVATDDQFNAVRNALRPFFC